MLNFSAKEMEVIENTSFLKTKQDVTVKIRKLLGKTRQELLVVIRDSGFNFPSGIDISMGKISRGENYQQLPYQVLDFPKLFKKQDIFAFRTMFWWGHFFSWTLHLQGRSLDKFRPMLMAHFDLLLAKDIYICVGETPWQYHYNEDNYVLLQKEHLEKIKNGNFLKFSQKQPLDKWSEIPALSRDFFTFMLNILSV
jgi:hypothetical protein